MAATTTIQHRRSNRQKHPELHNRPTAIDHAVRVINRVCCLAGSANLIDRIRVDLDADGVRAAMRNRDTAAVFDWLIASLSYQGISDQIAFDYMEEHGYVRWQDVNQKLAQGATCPKLKSYWHFYGCAYQKLSRTCALRRASKILAHHHVELGLAADLPMLDLDAVLFEQVLFNLLDNAAKYSPDGTTIRIQSWRDRDSVCLQVLDEGDGIPPAELEHIFDKFYRAKKGDQVRAGTGLGLAISRGFVEAMHGTITAANRTDRTGAVFAIRLPIPPGTEQLDTAA
jgi:signal transduction histidine kinase